MIAANIVMTAFHGIDLYRPEAYAADRRERIESFSFAAAIVTVLQFTFVILLPSRVNNNMILPVWPASLAARFSAISKNTFFKRFVESLALIP